MKYRIIIGTVAATCLSIAYASALLSEGLDAKASAHFVGLVLIWQLFDVIKALDKSA